MSGIVGGNLGRGSGLVKAGAIDDNAVTLAKMAGLARGKLIYGDASGDPAALAVGAADEVLTHDGTDFDWAAAAGGGKILQVVQNDTASASTHSAGSYTASNVTGAITPTAASSKIFVSVFWQAEIQNDGYNYLGGQAKIYQDIDGGGFAVLYPSTIGNLTFRLNAEDSPSGDPALVMGLYQNITFLDSPSYDLTEEITYTLYAFGGYLNWGIYYVSMNNASASVLMMEVAA